ncbi:MAG: rhomboid family intramembrane serine protease [Chthoniobacterales bacterium]
MAPVTVSLAALAVAVYALEVALLGREGPADLSRWALSGRALQEGMWWTLVTHLFLHGNLLHLAVNVLALWFIGPEVELMLGRVRYAVLYFVSGVAGGLLQTAFSAPTSELIGASGAVCGVLLSFTTACPEAPLRALLFFILPVSMKARTLGWGLIVVSLLCAVLGILPQIGHLAHLGGALAGAALTRWWLPVAPPRRRRPTNEAERAADEDELLRRVMEEGGIEGLSRHERKALERLAERRPRR